MRLRSSAELATLKGAMAQQEFTIQHLEPGDVDDIYTAVADLAPLTQHTWYTYWTEATCFGNSCFKAVDRVTGKLAGFVTSHPIRTTPRLEWFCWQIGVLNHYRKQGLAVQLVTKVIETACLAGAVALQFTVEPDNTASLATFQRISRTLNYELQELTRLITPFGVEVVYRMPLKTDESAR